MTNTMRALRVAVAAAFVVAALTAGQTPSAAAAPGAVMIESAQVTARVTAIDHAKRIVTLQMPDGKTRTFRLSRNIKNMAGLKVGDRITARLTDAVAVWVQKKGGPPSAAERLREVVTLTPRGVPEAAVETRTVRITAKVHHVDAQKRTVTITLPDNRTRTFKVSPEVNLASLKAGDDVIMRHTEALVLSAQKPK